ncbi:MAG: aldose 1-epimerase family protein [Bacteroidales bacterium]|nr:aldose 1-epimerase family protein [Candidatus Colimorpha onthohippi]
MTLSNQYLSAVISTHGAEVTSLRSKHHEYIWQADPTFWGRHAPLLFPIVGKVYNGTYRVDGHKYELPQHGFARDSEFELVSQGADYAELRLQHNAKTLTSYPYPFVLTIRYQLYGNQLLTDWQLFNPSNKPIFFQIGAHPAFNLPQFDPSSPTHGYLEYYYLTDDEDLDAPFTHITINRITPDGYVLPEQLSVDLPDGQQPITESLFKDGALIIEQQRVYSVVILDQHKQPVVEMSWEDADIPVLGIWRPYGAPFCCIEPWYGRADSLGFAGDISQRQYIQCLQPNQTFRHRHTIICRR